MNHSTESDADDVQSLDTIYDLLSDHRRRRAVRHLSGRESSISLYDLAMELASERVDSGLAEGIDRIALALHHAQLPCLDDADIIDYDVESRTITSIRVQKLTPYLDAPTSVSE